MPQDSSPLSTKPSTAVTHLLYLHGFRSSPQSTKARQMAALMAERYPSVVWLCPQLPPSPQAAAALIAQGTANWPAQTMAVMGSSLGGFYATWAAAQRGCKAVLINPAVFPARDLAKYIGEQTAWHNPDERFYFAPEFVDELRALESPAFQPGPDQLLALIAKGDEVLDWREMVARYPHAQHELIEDSDHALSDFETHLPRVLAFLDLA
ncbi:YqiA/YcfP family alpha/beta fold hydrolase [Limnohabitans sp. B9-3]|uniref:YqiA/YcfP family alpha/beta fold hydrolase n=1 Tax=Limnohabitans sp. B9-3 TaxID=1100707 RepID=UPI000C1E8D56|nr:YqiA/YcfP family alpha/beta fold hydrolase [Limnohabitans sp. B9-3]PIT71981.1 esterase [Limnohabitans sp. B9-3]